MATKNHKEEGVDLFLNIKGTFYLECLIDNYSGLILFLKQESSNEIFKMFFDSHLGYRNTDESERIASLNRIPELSDSYSFIRLSNSDFKDWIKAESCGVIKNDEVIHYVIKTPNDIVEVLSLEPPTTFWLKESELEGSILNIFKIE